MAAGADDAAFMAEAIDLSLTHLGQTGTNPSVGCLIVRDGAVVGRAVTAEGGRPHAETQALVEAGEAARGATAYVTLEPCSHHGKTPPCAEALIAAGIGRVVVAVTDPDERVAGRGLAMLRKAGIAVETGLLEREAARVLAGYLKRQTERRVHVTLKLAVSEDGMIGRHGAGQVAITAAAAREDVQRLRARCDAILVGIGTAIADDPLLTVRIPGLEHRSPLRVVLDRRLELPLGSKLLASARNVPLLLVSDRAHIDENAARADALRAAGAEIVACNSLESLLFGLASRGLSSLLVEGGAQVAKAFLEVGLVDRIVLYSAPLRLGPDAVAAPLDKAHMPLGFVPVDSVALGPDRRDIYERAD